MPQILELKEINGEIWARIGKPPDFPSGVALWTPDEQAHIRKLAARDAIEAIREPTEAMIEAAAATNGMKAVDSMITLAFVHGHKLSPDDPPPLLQAWHAMIDEALRDGQSS